MLKYIRLLQTTRRVFLRQYTVAYVKINNKENKELLYYIYVYWITG